MTNTKFRKRMLLSSVAMLLVALVALGSATFAWFTSSKTANATGLSFTTTASSGIVVASQTAKNLAGANGNAFSKTTVLNKQSNGSTGSAISFEPASFVQVDSTSKAAVMATTKSADPDDADAYNNTTPEAISQINYTSSGIYTTGIYAEKVYIKATGAATPVSVSGVTVAQHEGSKDAVFGAVNVLIVDDQGEVIWHANANGTAFTGSHLNKLTGGYQASARSNDLTAITDHAITGANIDSTGNRYVWVIVYLDGENEAVYTTNVAAESLIDSVDVSFAMP